MGKTGNKSEKKKKENESGLDQITLYVWNSHRIKMTMAGKKWKDKRGRK